MDQSALYREFHKPIYYTCLRILGSPLDAEECMHDAFIKGFSLGKFRYINEKAFYGWVKKAAVRGAIDRLRSLDFRKQMETESLDNSRVQKIIETHRDEQERTVQVEIIKKALQGMPSGYRVVLNLHLFEGYDFDEIAQIIERKPASVRSAYSRGRQKLLEEIKKHGYFKELY
ncbi:MAG: RNA polymerase sigma factor [Bacteroidales bacterium]|jgi:RNA polymerase sigma-70 factor (ECF subfamily)